MATAQHPVEQHEQMMQAMDTKLIDHEERLRRLEEIATREDEQTKQLWTAVGRIEQMINEMKEELRELSSKSGRKWDSLLGYVISGVVMLVIAYVGKVIFP